MTALTVKKPGQATNASIVTESSNRTNRRQNRLRVRKYPKHEDGQHVTMTRLERAEKILSEQIPKEPVKWLIHPEYGFVKSDDPRLRSHRK